jgi:hypothetical protein
VTTEAIAQVTFILYLAFFGWLGYRRGLLRESIVAITAILLYVILRERSETIITFANLAAAGVDFAAAGGFNGSEEEAVKALLSADKLVTPTTQDRFLYLVWVGGVVTAFLITTWWVPEGNKKNRGWAILVGMLNAFFFAIVAIPGLAALFGLNYTDMTCSGCRWDLLDLLARGLAIVWGFIAGLFGMIEPLGAAGIFVLIMSILIFAGLVATSSKSGSGSGSRSSSGSGSSNSS